MATDTTESASCTSPKSRAFVGHASTQAGLRSASGRVLSVTRSTHSVHFVITCRSSSSSRAP
jgi:hypothetical protein